MNTLYVKILVKNTLDADHAKGVNDIGGGQKYIQKERRKRSFIEMLLI